MKYGKISEPKAPFGDKVKKGSTSKPNHDQGPSGTAGSYRKGRKVGTVIHK